ncbi:hypothetical protein BDZ88DRAFT_482455 [Geranomyces variabilis]|nr:hypothetical protein BDZ88DRAFT_482455 [Geranomyces variabilis]KAJ3142263.1 hypothetical protein HDU90_004536 [Geranomyces variabilis]
MAPRKTAVKHTRVPSDESSPQDPLAITAGSPPFSNETATSTTTVVQKTKAPAKPRKRQSNDESSGESKTKKQRGRPAKKDSATANDVKTEQKATVASNGNGSKPTYIVAETVTKMGSDAEAWVVDQLAKQIMAGQIMNVRKVYEDYIARFSLQFDEFHYAHRSSFRKKASKAAAAMKAAVPPAPAPDAKSADTDVKCEAINENHHSDNENIDTAELDAMLADLVQGAEPSREVSCEA